MAGDKIPKPSRVKESEDITAIGKEGRINFIPIYNEIYYHMGSQDMPVGSTFECKIEKKEWEVPEDLLDTERRFYDIWKNKDKYEMICVKKYKDCYRKFRGYNRAVREFVFEETRKSYFPSLPSRASFFVFKKFDKCTFNFWYDELNRPDYLLELQLNGFIFCTTEEHLLHDTVSIDVLRKKSFDYWMGVPGSDPVHDEYIFVGKCKVLKNCIAKGIFDTLNRS